MRWSQVQKVTDPSLDGRHHNNPNVKEHVRQEAQFKCVYCAIHENSLGGVQVFHVDHYRPKSIFPALETTLDNFYYSCPICNRFKSNDWPADPDTTHSFSCYPDPSGVDYNILFEVDTVSGLISGVFIASKYMVEKLYFNRPQLILERKKYFLDQEMDSLHRECKSLIEQLGRVNDKESTGLLKKLALFLVEIDQLRIKLDQTTPYEVSDVTRPRS